MHARMCTDVHTDAHVKCICMVDLARLGEREHVADGEGDLGECEQLAQLGNLIEAQPGPICSGGVFGTMRQGSGVEPAFGLLFWAAMG